jgi:hypothetical protein
MKLLHRNYPRLCACFSTQYSVYRIKKTDNTLNIIFAHWLVYIEKHVALLLIKIKFYCRACWSKILESLRKIKKKCIRTFFHSCVFNLVLLFQSIMYNFFCYFFLQSVHIVIKRGRRRNAMLLLGFFP